MPASTLTTQSASRVERKRARNRDALVAAARRLFTTAGFEATTIAAIAEEADLGFGTFYRYFADKEAILEEVVSIGQREIDAVLAHPDNEKLRAAEALRALTARFARTVRRNHDLTMLVWQVGIRSETPGKRMMPHEIPPERSLPAQLATAVRNIIERGSAAGEFEVADAKLTSRFIASAHMYLFSPAAMKAPEHRLVEALSQLELGALQAHGRVTARRKAGRNGT